MLALAMDRDVPQFFEDVFYAWRDICVVHPPIVTDDIHVHICDAFTVFWFSEYSQNVRFFWCVLYVFKLEVYSRSEYIVSYE